MGKVVHNVFDNGERYPMVLDDAGLPDFWITLFVTENLRTSLTQTSIENVIRSLIHFRFWEEINNIDIIEEFRRLNFLTDADIASIRSHCHLDTRGLRDWQHALEKHRITKIAVRHPANVPHLKNVSKEHVTNRITHISKFLDFTAKTLLRRKSNYATIVPIIENMAIRIKSQKPKGKGDKGLSSDPNDKAPAPEIFAKFMSTISENSPENPYLNPGIRTRNARMFELMHDTGMRAGEILGLCVEDIDYIQGAVKVVRRHDNSIDPRAKQPVAKTLARNIPISKDLAKKIRAYVLEIRSTIPNANKGPFLFITHKKGKNQGMPISDSTFRNRILGPAIGSDTELYEDINRHGFRHNFNNTISKKIDSRNKKAKLDPTISEIKPKEEITIRMQLNGWQSEETAKIYTLRHIQELASEVLLKDMNENSKHIRRDTSND